MSEVLPVQSGYDRWAKVYDHDANPLQALEEPIVIARAGDVRGLDVLELGCGTGRHCLRMAAKGARVTAVDFSDEMLAEARAKPHAERVRFIEHDLHQPLPFQAEYDLVVCCLVLEHIKDIDAFYKQIHDALRESGRAILSLMHPVLFLKGTQARFTDPDTEAVVQVESGPHSVSEIVMAALRAGFQLDQISEHSPSEELAARFPRAEKYIGWPMLVVQSLSVPASSD